MSAFSCVGHLDSWATPQFVYLGLSGIVKNSGADSLCRILYGFPRSMSVSIM